MLFVVARFVGTLFSKTFASYVIQGIDSMFIIVYVITKDLRIYSFKVCKLCAALMATVPQKSIFKNDVTMMHRVIYDVI